MPARPSQTAREFRDLDEGSQSGSGDENDSLGPLGSPSRSGRRKRKRLSAMQLDEIFENMDPEEKARISREYRKLLAEADDMRMNVANTSVSQLIEKVKQGSKLFRDVRDTALASLDVRLILSGSETALTMARTLKTESNAFNIDEYLIRTKGILGLDLDELEDQDDDEDDELEEESVADRQARRRRNARKGRLGDWEKIGWMASKLSKRVSGVEFMFGPINIEPKKKTVKPRQKQVIAEETRPEEIASQNAATQKASEEDFVRNANLVAKVLRKRDPHGEGINFFDLVINPTSFGQSVENCFFVSFLIRDGKAGIEVEHSGNIIIRQSEPHDPEMGGEEPARNQAVMELTMEDWKLAIELYDIRVPMIKTRVYETSHQLAPNGWYT